MSLPTLKSNMRKLIKKGFTHELFYVPFSNGEVIIDCEEKIKWDNVAKEQTSINHPRPSRYQREWPGAFLWF